VRNRTTLLRHLLRMTVTLVAVPATGTGVAAAAEAPKAVTAEVETVPFGLLGPVGLAAVVLGTVGMALGVVRQRRKAQAEAAEPVTAEPAVAEAAAETRPTLTPYRRPTL
jgi:hypothetical protein